MKKIIPVLLIFTLLLTLGACSVGNRNKFTILSGSENDTLEPIIEKFAKDNNIDIEMKYKGSVDIMLDLEAGGAGIDAVWPANSLWISMGDKQHIVKDAKSVMTSPVVFGIRKSLAQQLGFVGRDVYVRDILNAINDKKLKFMMTSASQSNSGASAYIGFLYALLGNPDTITSEDLRKPELKEQIRKLLSGINRSSGSSGWLKDLFLQGDYDAMVNYESVIIDTNKELVNSGRESLYVVYPIDGLVISDSPLGYVDSKDSKKAEIFSKLQTYLLSDSVQKEILDLGRRTGFGGIIDNAEPKIFNPDWGIDAKKVLSPIRMPSIDVIQDALNLYQTEFKKPSFTVFCLDYSGSMEGDGESKLKEAMGILLNQEDAKKYMLQSSDQDVTVVIPFSDSIMDTWQVKGNDEAQLDQLVNNIDNTSPGGGTDIYTPVINSLDILRDVDLSKYIVSVVLMTDGESNTGSSFEDMKGKWDSIGLDIPVFSIMFGDASGEQLDSIAELTRARVFDGKSDLIDAFKKVRGYN